LRDQAVRASRSVVLNLAEGRARGGRAGKNHYRIVLGSAAESCTPGHPLLTVYTVNSPCAALDLATVADTAGLQEKLRRIGAILARLAR
jgi:four helix bundle protein